MALEAGILLGPYEVLGPLGAGGMGEVYRARDTRLGRIVAIKLVKAAFAERLEREAKTVASLNHPNICALYDIGADYLVLEYVEGKTLDQQIPRQGMRLSEALRIASQIADGLSRAHAAGVIHRDLKPSNVMITAAGDVKILDFGLAKPMGETSGEAEETRTVAALTEKGTIVGTIAYMSPEQAEGRKLDARSDIFSFGAMLYEMIAGHRAFQGESKVSVLAAILHQEPGAPAGISDHAWQIVRRCLRKDPARRWQTAADLKVALEEAREESVSGATPVIAGSISSRVAWWKRGAAMGLVACAAAALYWWRGPATASATWPVLTRLTWDAGLTTTPTLSTDGKLVAYASDRASDGNLDLWLQQIGGGDPIRLTDHPANDLDPSFSPDGRNIAFRSDRDGGGVYLISALGGRPRLLARNGHSPRFSPDGRWIAYRVGEAGGTGGERYFDVIPAEGGQATELPIPLTGLVTPIWSPDSRSLYATGTSLNKPGVLSCLTPIAGGKAACTPIAAQGGFAAIRFQSPPLLHAWMGSNLYLSATRGEGSDIYRQPMGSNGLLRGATERLTVGTAAVSGASVAVSPSGAVEIVFVDSSRDRDIWSIPLDAATGTARLPAQRFTSSPADEVEVFPTLDGGRIGYIRRLGSRRFELVVRDLKSAAETVLLQTQNERLALAADGKNIAYVQDGDLYVATVGEPVAQKLVTSIRGKPSDWSRDGRYLLIGSFAITGSPESRQVRMFDTVARKLTTLAEHGSWALHTGRFSPDGGWICFFGDNSAVSRQMFVARFHPEREIRQQEWVPISDGKALDREPRWSADGNSIYFLSQRDGFRCIWAQRLNISKKPSGDPFPVFHAHSARLSLDVGTDTGYNGLEVVGQKIYVSMQESVGNVWLATW